MALPASGADSAGAAFLPRETIGLEQWACSLESSSVCLEYAVGGTDLFHWERRGHSSAVAAQWLSGHPPLAEAS